MSTNRLLLLTPDFHPNVGGVARYLERLADHFADRITVVTSVQQVAVFPYKVIQTDLLFKTLWPHWMKSIFLLFQKRNEYD
ncbi:MAG: hypothetical protein AAB431_01430, partial [Patescibacteria group bacterium]